LGLSSNYTLSFALGTLAVNPAPLTIGVNGASRAFGDANPAFTANILGLKLGQDASVVTGLIFPTTATQTSGVGSYAVTSLGPRIQHRRLGLAPRCHGLDAKGP
jgi:hypothetical protein